MLKKLSLLFVFLWVCTQIYAQNPPKRELRGVWIATIENIDWPSKKGLSDAEQKAEIDKILDYHKSLNINAVYFQVRAASDAFYAKGQIEPWSEWLSGTQGKAPGYDPLAYIIEACHKRAIECHAWLNLNRGRHKSAKSIAKNHITNIKPSWFTSYGGYTLFDFGQPVVRNYQVEIVENLVKNYDLDGIHFDDYFYPYTLDNEVYNDRESFKKYGENFKNVNDWRRYNINVLVKDIARAIKQIKPWVKFGISPFGVWANKSTNADGSNTQAGQTSYDNLYADTRLWSKENWIDYMVPQVYFSTTHPKVPYKTLADWWVQNTQNRHLYMGIGAYKMGKDKDSAWQNPQQISEQIAYNRNQLKIDGALFFSSKSLINNALGMNQYIKENYKYPAFAPQMPWLVLPDVTWPRFRQQKSADTIQFNFEKWPEHSKYAVVYKFTNGKIFDFNNPANIESIQYIPQNLTIKTEPGARYAITILDRLWNESSPIHL